MPGARLTALWLGYLFFVVYGSLVPLDFRPMPLERAWVAFQHVPYLDLGLESRADWLANGVLYFPLGYLSATVLMRAVRPAWRVPAMLLALITCLIVDVGVEFTQEFFPPRTVSQNDIIAEAIGSFLGVIVAPFLLPWLKRLGEHWSLGGEQLRRHVLQAYAVAYVLLCLFPYDFLLSMSELHDKVNSQTWGWLLAGNAERPALVLLLLASEVVLAVPFGFLAARRPGSGFWPGLFLGLAIEGAQFFIHTAVTQGLSVVTRVLGVMLGVALWRRRERLNVDFWAAWIRRYGLWLAPVYLVALSIANGWLVNSWHGLAGAVAMWPTVRFMPFYYHYYTTEAHALVSLVDVSLMYMPLAVLAWAHRWRMRRLLLASGALCAMVECSKLFLSGSRPDPTNVIIAMTACAMTVRASVALTRARSEAATTVAPFEATAVTAPSGKALPWRQGLLAIGLAWIGFCALRFPAFAPALFVLLVACAVAVWLRPVLALAIIPAALPVLDLAPWSGRFYWDEFDLLIAVCLLVGFVRAPPNRRGAVRWDALSAGFVLLALSFALSTWAALRPWQAIDANSFISYTSHYNVLRIVKGGLWAWGFVLLFSRLADGGEQRVRLFSQGMQIGLALTLLFVLWERAAFVGLFDFSTDYRVTGPISAMHKGGAYIECYLAVASAFALGSLLRARTWSSRLPAALLVLLATYGVMVTYSRNGYAALAVVVLFMLVARMFAGPREPRRLAASAGVLILVAVAAAPIVAGTFARARLAGTGSDLVVREAHWRDALEMRSPSWKTTLFGVGVGRFPEQHFWHSNEAMHAGTYAIETDASGNGFLRLGTGTAIYMEQIVELIPGQDYVLGARVRSNRVDAEMSVQLCQKWMLTSALCEAATLKTGPEPNAWEHVEATLKSGALTDQPWYARRPLKLALVSPAKEMTLDIDDVHLEARPGSDALQNGDFSAGLDHWFFTTDVDPPWHIHSLPVAILFDQGWFGVLAWSLVCVLALYNGVKRARRGSLPALTATAALLGFLVSGSLNTLIDAPRFLWLLLVISWLCRGDDDLPQARDPQRRGKRQRAGPVPDQSAA